MSANFFAGMGIPILHGRSFLPGGDPLRAPASVAVLALRALTGVDSGGRRLRAMLLASQVALSLTLLTGASLLTRGVLHAYDVDFGFEASRIAVGRIQVPDAGFLRRINVSVCYAPGIAKTEHRTLSAPI